VTLQIIPTSSLALSKAISSALDNPNITLTESVLPVWVIVVGDIFILYTKSASVPMVVDLEDTSSKFPSFPWKSRTFVPTPTTVESESVQLSTPEKSSWNVGFGGSSLTQLPILKSSVPSGRLLSVKDRLGDWSPVDMTPVVEEPMVLDNPICAVTKSFVLWVVAKA